jgi:hypothetical protein
MGPSYALLIFCIAFFLVCSTLNLFLPYKAALDHNTDQNPITPGAHSNVITTCTSIWHQATHDLNDFDNDELWGLISLAKKTMQEH